MTDYTNNQETKDITLTGVIKFIKYDAEGFQTFIFKTNDGKKCSCRSNFPKESIENMQEVSLIGHWVNDPRYGWQFEVLAKKMPVPTDLDGIRLFLLKHIKGVGPALADYQLNTTLVCSFH